MDDYYTLERAANIAGLSVDEIIKLGADGKSIINIMTIWLSPWYIVSMQALDGNHIGKRWMLEPKRHAQLERSCLLKYFSGRINAQVRIEPSKLDDDSGLYKIYVCRRQGIKYTTDSNPDPIKLSECRMIIFQKDLEKLFTKPEKPVKNKKSKYEQRVDSYEDYLKDHDVTKLIKADILKKLQLISKDKSLWNITPSTFNRDFWGEYQNEKNKGNHGVLKIAKISKNSSGG